MSAAEKVAVEAVEARVVRAMTGGARSVLATDGYKFSMAQAGFPLRRETFYLTLRKGGPFYVPFDLRAIVRGLLPPEATLEDAMFLDSQGYSLTPAMEAALASGVDVDCPPAGSWVLAGEPLLTVTGASFLVSWLEPYLLMLHYPIQIASAMARGSCPVLPTTCDDEREIVRCVEAAVGRKAATGVIDGEYRADVRKAAAFVVDALGGDGHRAFEVGMRAATCLAQHLIALEECKAAGITRTSNVLGAAQLGMKAVGTTGHEHQMRHGDLSQPFPDLAGYRAVRDCRPGVPSALFDTFDPIRLGIPAAVRAMRETPGRTFAARFDSGDQDGQLRLFVGHETTDRVSPTYIFEDSYNAERTRRNEAFCETLEIPRARRQYGYGGFLVSAPSRNPLHRDAVSAAYKLACTNGRAVMKFSGDKGKRSLPGCPVILRRIGEGNGAESLVAQVGEIVPGYAPVGKPGTAACASWGESVHSPRTAALVAMLQAQLEAAVRAALHRVSGEA